MTKTIVQQVKFGVAPERLYDIYMDSKKHGAATGSVAKVSKKVGSEFKAWDGYIAGKILALFPKRAIVQTWRAADWKKTDSDSILTIGVDKAPGGSLLTLVHAGVPDNQYEALKEGWVISYWDPWKAYLGLK